MDNRTIKAWLEQQTLFIRYSIYCLVGILSLVIYSWIWGLLLNLFYPVGFSTPWLAPSLLLNYAYNTTKLNFLLMLTFFAPPGFVVLVIYGKYKKRYLDEIYGDAHWATLAEIKKMGLLNNHGLFIGRKYGYLLRIPLVSHIFVFAKSRSGKGVSQLMPNVLTFKDSMLIVDLKQEIFRDTSGFRAKHGQKVFLFAPASLNFMTHCWNPLDLISRHPARLDADIQLVVEVLISQKNDKDNFWISEARALAAGLLLWLMDSGRPFTIGELAALIKGTPNFVGFLKQILVESVTKEGKITIHSTAYQNINNFVQKAEKEQSGIKSTITSCLHLLDDPLINAATSRSDFDVRNMRRERMTVYLGIPANQLDRLAPLINLFIQLFLKVLTEELPKADEPYKVLAVLDEICALGRMPIIKTGYGYFAGYNIHLMSIIQNLGQYYELYGRDGSDVFFQNTDCIISYRQNTRTDREFVSEQLGTRRVKTYSTSSQRDLMTNRSGNVSESYSSRPLLTPEQVRRFPEKQGIAIISGHPPIRYKRILHYKDKGFKERILPSIEIPAIAPFYPTLKIKKPPLSVPADPNHQQTTLAKQLTSLLTIAQQLTPEKKEVLSETGKILDVIPNVDDDLEIAD